MQLRGGTGILGLGFRSIGVFGAGTLLSLAGCRTRSPESTLRTIAGQVQQTRYVSPGAYEHYLRGELLLQQGAPEPARDAFRIALGFDPTSPFLHTRLAAALRRLDQFDAARRHLDRALDLNPGSCDALLLRAEIAQTQRRPAVAEAHYRRCLDVSPDHARATLALATLLQQHNRRSEAQRLLRQLLANHPLPAAHRQLAQLCLAQLKLQCAKTHLQALNAIAPRRKSFLYLARVAIAQQDRPRAAAHLRAVVRCGIDLHTGRQVLQMARRLDDASLTEMTLTALVRDADPKRVHTMFGMLLSAGLAREAWRLAQAAELSLGDDARRLLRAITLAQAGHRRRARLLLAGLAGHTHSVDLTLALADRLLDLGDHDRAAHAMTSALRRWPAAKRLPHVLVDILRSAGQLDRAHEIATTYLQQQPDDAQWRLQVAATLERMGRWRESVALMRKLLQHWPDDAAAHNLLGFTLVDHGGDAEEAEQHIRRALDLRPFAPHIVDSLGWFYHRSGALRRARQTLTIAARLEPDDGEIVAHLAEVYASAQESARALALYRRALRQTHDVVRARQWRLRIEQLRLAQATSTRHARDASSTQPKESLGE